MNKPNEKRKKYINSLSSVYTDVDFLNNLTQTNERAYWFETKRIDAWLLKDTRYIVEKGESLFGLAALIFIGIETISTYRYGDSNNYHDPRHPSNRFPQFLEEYIDSSFSIKRVGSINFHDGRNPGVDMKDSQIFYRGMRNSLMHSFSFRKTALISPQLYFKYWLSNKQILRIDARKLLVKFEDGIIRYFKDLWTSQPGNPIYENFKETFESQFIT